jgi:hypothetical protein
MKNYLLHFLPDPPSNPDVGGTDEQEVEEEDEK